MKRMLVPLLICPACLPKEHSLQLTPNRETNGDVLSGLLSCRNCHRDYPIKDGVAILLRDPGGGSHAGQWRYEEDDTLNRYLWSHFGDLWGAPEAGDAYRQWADCLPPTAASGLDVGCAVGRLTFEMAARFDLAIGCDLSSTFIRTARKLATERRITCTLPLEGKLLETFTGHFPTEWQTANVEFIVADAQALPLARSSFGSVATLNLLDRVHYPLAHLYEINRVAAHSGANLLCADPFSWSTATTPEENWLGGTTSGPYRGRGIDNVRNLLEGKGGIIAPPWQIVRHCTVDWRLRTHSAHHETMRSQTLSARR